MSATQMLTRGLAALRRGSTPIACRARQSSRSQRHHSSFRNQHRSFSAVGDDTSLDSKVTSFQNTLRQRFPDSCLPAIEVFDSPDTHYRHDVQFTLVTLQNRPDDTTNASIDDGQGQEDSTNEKNEKPDRPCRVFYALHKRYDMLTPEQQEIADTQGHYGLVQKKKSKRGRGRRKTRKKASANAGTDSDVPPMCRVLVRESDLAAQPINELMPELLKWFENDPVLRKRCFEVRFRSTLHSEQILVVLLYHRSIRADTEWRAAVEEFRRKFPNTTVVGRARKEMVPCPVAELEETYKLKSSAIGPKLGPIATDDDRGPASGTELNTAVNVPSQSVRLTQPETCFIQANARVRKVDVPCFLFGLSIVCSIFYFNCGEPKNEKGVPRDAALGEG